MPIKPFGRAASVVFILALPLTAARADEGMWTIDAFPTAKMKAAYGWAPDQAWLDKVRGAAVRLTGGCSASFVSPNGLILTNHHCVATCVEQNSTDSNNILATGFTAGTRERELKCAGQQAEVVTSIADVTLRVKAAIGSAKGEAAVKARSAVIADIEKAGCTDTATTRCQVVSLYGGGQYKLSLIANIRMSGWRGPPRHRPQGSAAIPTISTSRATRWMPASCALMKTASPSPRRSTSSGPRARRSMANRPSSSAIPDRPSGCRPRSRSPSPAKCRRRSR